VSQTDVMGFDFNIRILISLML